MKNLDALFDDKRVLCLLIACWTVVVTVIFVCIMIDDNSPFLSFGPNPGTVLFGFKLDTWTKWACVAMYTFMSTCIADFTCDSVGPFVTNTIQDHKNLYIPYSKTTCVVIVQVFAVYAIIMNTIGLFVALSQVDFMMIRMSADLMVNYYTCHRFMRYKSVNAGLYEQYMKSHCIETVHFSGPCDEADKQLDAATELVERVQPAEPPPQPTTRTRPPLPTHSRAPVSDEFEGMVDAKESADKEDEYAMHSPADKEDEKSALFGVARYA